MPAHGMRSDQSLVVTPRLATQSRRRRPLSSARRCGVLASRHAPGATGEHRLQAVVLGVGVVVGLALLQFHQLRAVRSDDRDRRCSRSQASTFCLVANGRWSGFLEANAGPVIVSWNRVCPIRRFCKRAIVQGVTYGLAASIVTVSRCGKGSPSAQRCTYSVPITGGLPLASS